MGARQKALLKRRTGLNMNLIVQLAEKYPEKFSRQRVALWQHGINRPNLGVILYLADEEQISDMNIFFVQGERE